MFVVGMSRFKYESRHGDDYRRKYRRHFDILYKRIRVRTERQARGGAPDYMEFAECPCGFRRRILARKK